MTYALNLDVDGRILSATYPQYASENAVMVDILPDRNLSDYLYSNGEFMYQPISDQEEKPPTPTMEERLSSVESDVAALKEETSVASILLGEESV